MNVVKQEQSCSHCDIKRDFKKVSFQAQHPLFSSQGKALDRRLLSDLIIIGGLANEISENLKQNIRKPYAKPQALWPSLKLGEVGISSLKFHR
jgi:hypothetical protein